MRLRGIVVLASLALAVSCGSDGPNEPSGSSGTFTFSFAGTMISGSYSASGSSNASNTQPWAAGFLSAPDNAIGVIAVSPRAGTTGRYDQVFLAADRITEGTASVDADCGADVDETCAGMVLFYNSSDAGGNGEILCVLETGSITIASISSTRTTGTFSGSGTCVNQDNLDEGTFTVTNGSFNVPLVTGGTGGGSVMRRSR